MTTTPLLAAFGRLRTGLVTILLAAVLPGAAAAALYIDPTAVDLGYLRDNEGAIIKVAVVNVGDAPVPVVFHLLEDFSAFEVIRGGGARTLAPGERHVAWVRAFGMRAFDDPVGHLLVAAEAPPVVLSATSRSGTPVCAVGAREIDFDQVAVSDSLKFSVPVTAGTTDLSLRLSTTNPDFFVSPATLRLPAGATVNIEVGYRPSDVGDDAGSLILGDPTGQTVTLRGMGIAPVIRTADLVGVWMDEGLTRASTEDVTAGRPFDAWLAMINPSEPEGVGAWELALDLDAGTYLTENDLAGLSFNILAAPEFCVGLAQPLPQAPVVVLARLRFTTVDQQWHEIRVKPISRASIPGSMAWAYGPEYTIKPLYPATGLPAVAWFRASTTVAVAAPAPSASLAGGAVVLSWPLPTDGSDGCHLYRSIDGVEVRLNHDLLRPSGSGFVYRDDLVGVAAGAHAVYSYALVQGGAEIARSPGVSVDVPGAAGVTRLVGAQPNPFNPETAIVFELARAGQVRLAVFDVSGRRVAVLVDGLRDAGRQQAVWHGRDDTGRPLPSGAYFARLETERTVDTRRLMLVK